MSKRTCTVPDCERPHNDHGYCSMHGQRVRRRGTPDEPPPRRTDVEHRPPRRLVTAADLSDRHVGRCVRIGHVEGVLTGIVPRPNGGGVDLAVLVGGVRAWFGLEMGAEVEVWRAAS
jgi:hypothetical protein